MPSRNIDDLQPVVRLKAVKFIDECKKAGIDVIIISTYRNYVDQEKLYAIGRIIPGKKVTNAMPGYSYHNFRVAFDFLPLVNGKADWNNIELFKQCGDIGKKLGLEYAGDWKRFREYGLLQFTGGLSLANFRAGRTLGDLQTKPLTRQS